MGRKSIAFLGLLLIAGLGGFAQQTGSQAFEFIENKGQWDPVIRFKGELSAGAFYLHNNGFTVLQHNISDLRAFHRHPIDREIPSGTEKTGSGSSSKKPGNHDPEEITVRSHAYRVRFLGASEDALIQPDKLQSAHNNYFIGNDPSKWASNVRVFQAVVYKDIYPNIDIRYYSGSGKLKYDLVVHPGGDPANIVMAYEGAGKLSIKNKELLIQTSVGTIKELYPYSFQFDEAAGKKEIDCRYEIVNGNQVRFRLKKYDPQSTLIIDPTLIFSSFTGSQADNWGFTATPGPDGSLYSGGIVFGQGFPVTPGAFKTTYGGGASSRGNDVGIMKFNSTGTALVYATYLGGSSNEYPHSLFCDPQGNLVVMGRTYSGNFPTTVPTIEKSPGLAASSNIFVTKLNASGSALIGSVKIGGSANDAVNIEDHGMNGGSGINSLLRNYGDETRSEVVLDGAGNIYVAATSQSADFPTTAGSFQPAKKSGQDGVILKINPNCDALIWASYIGGDGDDGAFVMEVDPTNGDLYVAGATSSVNFPVSSSGVIQSGYSGGDADGFVAIISNNGTALKTATFLGTSAVDIIYGIKFDRLGFPYVMGTTRGNWPVLPAGVWSVPNSKQFVAKLKPDLSAYVYSTVFGSGGAKPNMSPVAFLVDRCENVYISGWGGWLVPSSIDPYDLAGVANMPVTPDAIKQLTDNRDMYFIVIKKNASALLYGSYFGQDGGNGEHVDGGTSRFDGQGVIYQAICANCAGGAAFPTTPGVVAPSNGAVPVQGCNLAAVKISFNFSGVGSGVKSAINGVTDNEGCVPLTVDFRDTILNATSYEWDFGDGTVTGNVTSPTISHTYTAIGNYRVMLIAIDSNSCNIRDTSYLNIRVRNDEALLAMNSTKLPPCQSLSYRFDNFSTPPSGKPFSANSFIWDFGDGMRVLSGPGAITHAYTAAGTYKVRLVLVDTNYCNSPDSIELDLRIAPNVVAQFETPPSGCVPYQAVFTNTSLAGQQFRWDFGDGNTSTEVNPTHLYSTVGSYRIKLIAIDSATCNIIDSTERTITINPNPVAAFSYTPTVPETNKPVIFSNQSTGGTLFKWMFGDGDSVVKTTPDTVLHQYNSTGTFEVCLIAYNQFGCSDTVCTSVQAVIVPLLDVPNAFTPGRFGRNSIVRVEGFGIAKMTWRIYNRWGQKIFETGDRKSGWDGTYKGQLQPMDVYTYTLEVEFSDGTRTKKTGDITLIR